MKVEDAGVVAIQALAGWLTEIVARLDHAGIPFVLSHDDNDALQDILNLRAALGPAPGGRGSFDSIVADVRALRAVADARRPSRSKLDRAGLCYHTECIDRGDPTPTTLLRNRKTNVDGAKSP